FVPVSAPNTNSCKLIEDKTDRAAVTLISVVSKTAKGCAWPVAEWIGAEIAHLIQNQAIVHNLDGSSRSLGYQDIAILVPYRSDAFYLKRVLTGLNIPYAMYKEEGLYATEESLHLQIVLEALLSPEDFSCMRAALLTPLFGLNRDVVLNLTSLPQGHSVRERMETLLELAQKGRLSALLKLLLEEGPYAKAFEWERAYTNYRQITEQLLERHVTYGSSVSDLLRYIKSLRHEAMELSRDQNLLRLPGEEARVQIMTMHMSKGLQYPVVFVAGGYTRNPFISSVVCHPPKKQGGFERVYIHRPNSDSPYYDLITEEMEQVQLRLLYVAFTRARYKLYLPYWVSEEKQKTRAGYLLSTIAPALQQLKLQNPALGIEISEEKRPVLTIKERPAVIPQKKDNNPFLQGQDVSQWKVESDFSLYSRKLERRSFSGLARMMYPEEYQFGLHRQPDEPKEPVSIQLANDSLLQSLPRGAEFGSLIHALMEVLDFEETQKSGVCSFFLDTTVDHLFTRQQIGLEFKESVLQMLYQALWVQLPMVDTKFRLIDLKNSETLREKEFWFTPVVKSGFVFGAQDFLFRWQGKYWIVDWKSNWLEDYSIHSLNQCMESSHYDLQARIYGIALRRWLKIVLGDRGDTQFGGILYLFLRGMKAETLDGVYCISKDSRDWDEEENLLEEIL
ncbi:MAG: PD-(D/E)XK nuclease family protein, partial [Candidatus Cloacimonetes bacterium]|nr:PD-(D/E)XK nuclease family protein [Candidatus Cloacimonadota bacterium]